MEDIKTRSDIELIVNNFYKQVKTDLTIGYIFTEIAGVNWDEHLPRMYNFWETILLNKASFKGNPMSKHIQLSKKTPINQKHFDQWIFLWKKTIDAFFEGEIAENAKQRGINIAGLMLYKIQN